MVKVEPYGEYVQNMVKANPYGGWNGGVDDGVAGFEELDNMLGNIFDFPDLPMESIEDDGLVGEWDTSKSHYLGPIPTDVLVGAPTMTETKIDDRPPVFIPGPAFIDTKPEAKHQTYQFEDPASLYIRRQNKSTEIQEPGTFQSQSPVSVLENSGSSSSGKSLPLKSHATKRTRSKRARPLGVSPWIFISISPTSRKACDAKKTKERRKKSPCASVTTVTTPDNTETLDAALPRPTKKCTHCEITKTPQWREGPLGPKTLCNACGVRYRSGRLFPEYRPAASPTFVPSLHSNSHKKVIEMRNKSKHEVKKIEQAMPASSYLLDYIC